MPSDVVFKGLNAMHKGLLKLSGGRIGNSAAGMPVLELTTVGRKSGEKRSVILTSPHQEGDTIVIVASRGGDPKHPAWYHNICANSSVEVAWKGGPPKPMRARPATAEERARLWPLVTKKYGGYAQYQKRATREIPLVLLEPAGQ